jgi:phage terminase Nu1 subunit (DNA packaging protein)
MPLEPVFSRPVKGAKVTTITALAQALSMSRVTLNNYIRRGIVRAKADGSFDTMRVYATLERHVAKQERGNENEGAQLRGVEKQRERKLKAEAQLKEIELSTKERELIHSDSVRELLLRIGAVIGQRFANLNNVLPVECESKTQAELQAIIGEKLEEAARSINEQIGSEETLLTLGERDSEGRVDIDD